MHNMHHAVIKGRKSIWLQSSQKINSRVLLRLAISDRYVDRLEFPKVPKEGRERIVSVEIDVVLVWIDVVVG
jgi:hypothetical protein